MKERRMNRTPLEQLVAGRYMNRTLWGFMDACGVAIEEEQRKLAPETHLIALLCDAIRLAREMLLMIKRRSR